LRHLVSTRRERVPATYCNDSGSKTRGREAEKLKGRTRCEFLLLHAIPRGYWGKGTRKEITVEGDMVL